MNELAIGLLGALLATNQPQAVSNVIQAQTGVAINLAVSPEEKELREVMIADDAAQDEVNQWLHDYDSQADTNKTAAASAALSLRIKARFGKVRDAYDNFLQRHPESAHGFLAYGSFLNDIGDEEGAHLQYENSLQLDPKNPAVSVALVMSNRKFTPLIILLSFQSLQHFILTHFGAKAMPPRMADWAGSLVTSVACLDQKPNWQ